MDDYDFGRVAFRHVAVYKEIAWFCNQYYNALFKIDIRKKKIFFERVLPCNNNRGFRQYGAIASYENYLVIAPLRTGDILIYDMDTKELRSIPLEVDKYTDGRCFNLFFSATVYGNSVFLFPGRFQAIVKIELPSGKCTYYSDWYADIKPYIADEFKILFSISNERKGSKYYLPFWQNNIVICFDMEDGSHETILLDAEGCAFSGIQIEEKFWWISLKEENTLLKCDSETKSVIKKVYLNQEFCEAEGILAIKINKNELTVIPTLGKAILNLDTLSEKIQIKYVLPDQITEDMSPYVYEKTHILCVAKAEDDLLIMYSNYDGKIIIANLNNDHWESWPAVVDDKNVTNVIRKQVYLTKRWRSPALIRENVHMDLQDYVDCLTRLSLKGNTASSDSCVGGTIYKKLIFAEDGSDICG